jgi:hypothetical protein
LTPPRRRGFARQWAFVGLLAAAALAYGLKEEGGAAPPAPVAAHGRGVAYFSVVRLPPVTAQYESGEETMRLRYGEWLDALAKAGFKPMRLSDVAAALESGRGVPEKTLVSLFEPGYRRTLTVVGPILRSHEWPAVWLTDSAAMRRGHREFVTYHDARGMRRSRWWDVGYSLDGGGYSLQNEGRGGVTLGRWSELDGTFSLNRGPKLESLSVLNVSSDWLADELVRRLAAELPASGPTLLTKGTIQRREWGLGRPLSAGAAEPFDLRAGLIYREARLYWLSTRGLPDFRLRARVRSLVGQFRLHLRSDEAAGRRITVTFTRQALRAVETSGGATRTLFSVPRGGEPGLDAEIVVRGRRLTLSSAGRAWSADVLQDAAGAGLLEASVFEKMRGAARADGVALEFTPL